MPEFTWAPWTPEQVDALNRAQRCGRIHPFTCGSGNRGDAFHAAAVVNYGLGDAGQLHATRAGWICNACDYTQSWAHAFMLKVADWGYPWPSETGNDTVEG